ncbi:MAG TPA: hypothetical protein VI434_13950 [Candidatus Dormibacteraeota bacterium]
MGGAVDWDDSLPLLPAGTPLFDALPARAIVLDALAPAVADGLITVADRNRRGVLVVRRGGISDAVSIDGARHNGDVAMESIHGWDAALMSAARLTEDAMSILGPVLNGERCYEDLRLEWTRWSELLDDLRGRGRTYVVEVRTPAGCGVTVIRGGQQVATYTDAHPSLGAPDLIDALVQAGSGSLRVTISSERSVDSVGISATGVTQVAAGSAARVGLVRNDDPPPAVAEADSDDGNATLTALFGGALGSQTFAPLVVLDRATPTAGSSVAALLPELQLLVQGRLQRSAGPVENVIATAADGGASVAWLADRVRVMSVRGFMTSTFEQLADDMLALARE